MAEKREYNLEGDSHVFEKFLQMIVPICTVSISNNSSKQMILQNGFQAPTDRLQAPTACQRQPLVPTPIVHDAQGPGWVPLLCTIQGKVVLVRVPRWRQDPLV